jgi:MICOS complex subunit MIC12
VEPLPPLPPPTSREVRVGLLETAKDKWNAELENNVRKLYNVDWSGVRERMEEGVSAVYRRAFEKGREGVAELSSNK